MLTHSESDRWHCNGSQWSREWCTHNKSAVVWQMSNNQLMLHRHNFEEKLYQISNVPNFHYIWLIMPIRVAHLFTYCHHNGVLWCKSTKYFLIPDVFPNYLSFCWWRVFRAKFTRRNVIQIMCVKQSRPMKTKSQF